MIETGSPQLTAGIKECWRKCFTMDDPRYIEFFFRYIYKPDYGFADVEDGSPVSTVTRIPHALMFNGRVLSVSMLKGMCTMPDFRHQARIDRVMETVLDACSHQELITLAPAEFEKGLKKYGFQPAWYRTDYTISRDQMKRITNYGCAYEPSPIDMLKVYSAFIRRFNGYYARDLESFVNLKREIASRGGKIVAYYDGKNRIQGYATILIEGVQAKVEECIYLNSVALSKLLNAALLERNLIHLHVSQAENVGVLFPDSEKVDYPYMLMRINNPELLSRLFSTEIKNVSDLTALSVRPMNLNENH